MGVSFPPQQVVLTLVRDFEMLAEADFLLIEDTDLGFFFWLPVNGPTLRRALVPVADRVDATIFCYDTLMRLGFALNIVIGMTSFLSCALALA